MAFQEREDVESYLTPPTATSPSDTSQNILFNMSDVLSPSQWVNAMITHVVGFDLLGYIGEAFAGNWENVSKYSDAFSKLSQAIQAIGINVSSGNVELDASWQGNAADARWRYFTDLASEISELQFAFDKLSKLYADAADGTYRAASSCAALFAAIVDRAILAALSASVGAITAETGVGAIGGGALSAYAIKQMIDKAKNIQTVVITATNAANLVVGEINATAVDVDAIKRFPLPATGYKAPPI